MIAALGMTDQHRHLPEIADEGVDAAHRSEREHLEAHRAEARHMRQRADRMAVR